MPYKLSILPRKTDQTGWHQSSQFKAEQLQEIKVNDTGHGKSLNSIPSPFARMYLFATAFDMVRLDLNNKSSLAGESYNKLVSDCLDVFELLYNWKTHVREGRRLELITWNQQEELKQLTGADNEKHAFLARTLQMFLKGEPALTDMNKYLIIKYDGKVIAGTSPITGFFTTPDELDKLDLLKPQSSIAYFSQTIPFNLRLPEVKKYIFDFFEDNELLRGSAHVMPVRKFLSYQNIPKELNLQYTPLLHKGLETEAFGRPLMCGEEAGIQYFEPTIIRLDYRLNEACFCVPRNNRAERTYDYLLPLTEAFYSAFAIKDVNEIVKITEHDEEGVTVSIRTATKEVFKRYRVSPDDDQDGRIIKLSEKDQIIKFNIGIFPFLKVTEQPDNRDYNDFYRVMVVMKDDSNRYSNKDIKLAFGKDGKLLETGTTLSADPVHRTIFEAGQTVMGSTYYGLQTCFDFIQIKLPPVTGEQTPVKATIVPNWREKKSGNRQVDFSIDLGSTSTFIACTDDRSHGTIPKPFEFNEDEVPVVLLNRILSKKAGASWTDTYEKSINDFFETTLIQREEFIPSIIKKGEKYEFPIRTVLYQQRGIAGDRKALCDTNISFIYQKKGNATPDLRHQEFKSDLKWNIKASREIEDSISVFIEELFILMRTKVLLSGGHPGNTNISWFAPMSFTAADRRAYEAIWSKHFKHYFKPTGGSIRSLTESEAPFYYLFKDSSINDTSSVLTVDIGGGSTDIMLFHKEASVLGSSIHFGANVLWGNGFSEFVNEKNNGIYLAIRDEITKRLNPTELKKLNEDYCNGVFPNVGSDEIINFWISNNDLTQVLSRLNKGEFRLSYLLHLSVLIYYTLQLLKNNHQAPPTCVIFSGNGSRYIDFIHTPETVGKIWKHFIQRIFGGEAKPPQIILPENDRKEATCYGGLFIKQPSNFKSVNYLGFEKPDEVYTIYDDIKLDDVTLSGSILTSVDAFIDCFFAMNETKELNFRYEFGIETNVENIRQLLKEKAPETFHQGYAKRFKKRPSHELVSDSLFYYPFVGLLYKLNKLSEEELNRYSNHKLSYAGTPDGDGSFLHSSIMPTRGGTSVYTILQENDHTARVDIIDDPSVHQRALRLYEVVLDPICDYNEFPQTGQAIKVLKQGKAIRDADKWVIQDKVEIEFV